MTKARFFLHDLSQTSSHNNGDLPLEIWGVIFKELEPTFLNSVLRTSRLFNAVATSETVFKPLLDTFYEDIHDGSTQPHKETSYETFKRIYANETAPLSKPARKLLDLCQFSDIQHIQIFTFEPDILFETDTNRNYVLTLINRQCTQAIRDLLFAKIHEWFEKTTRINAYWDDFPMSLLLESYSLEKLFRCQTDKEYILMDFAVGLNQLDFIKQHAEYFKERYYVPSEQMSHFQAACLFGHLDIIKYMLTTGNPLQPRASAPTHPLIFALNGNQHEVIEFLLITHRHLITTRTLQTAAYLAVNDGRLDSLDVLLTYIDDMAEYEYVDNNNLLTLACQHAQHKAARLLLEAYPDWLDDHFDRCLLLAARAGCTPLVSDFIGNIEDISTYFSDHPELLINAAGSGNVDLVAHLLEIGAPINAADSHGETALHKAASNGHLPMVKLLLEHNADINLTNRGHMTALDIAKISHNQSLAHYLMTAQYEQGKKRRAESNSGDEDFPAPNRTRPRY